MAAVLTLQKWAGRLLNLPCTIDCPAMLLRTNHGETVFEGPGHIKIVSRTRIEFTMYAKALDEAAAFQYLVRAQNNPYEAIAQFILEATDYEGVHWNGGWTYPELSTAPAVGRLLTGLLDSLTSGAGAIGVSHAQGVELVVDPKLDLRMEQPMLTTTTVAGEVIERRRRAGSHVVEVLGSSIKFFYEPSVQGLWLSASCSEALSHPHIENWLLEPLRILTGKLIYPRLVARNFGDGTAMVQLRMSPPRSQVPGFTGVLSLFPDRQEAFWRLYPSVLRMIVLARDKSGHPNFNEHPVTHFYVEIAQAAEGSRWVLYLSLASAVEGIAKMLMANHIAAEKKFESESIDSLKRHLQAWDGDKELKQRVMSDLARANTAGISQFLRQLVMTGKLEKRHAAAWNDVRNKVMHGNLVDPWATEEDDVRMENLASLLHHLTLMLIDSPQHPTASSGL